MSKRAFAATLALLLAGALDAFAADAPPSGSEVEMEWGVRIPMRDGVRLNATVFRPKGPAAPLPVIFTLTPYVADGYTPRALFFARHGYVFALVDARGRGNSEGTFVPFENEGRDGHDVVEWLAAQPFSNGKVAMRGGSYAGYDQWVTLKERPPHLATIVPAADYGRIGIPVLTITGQYDDDQPGALSYYRADMAHGTAAAKARHILLVGPWDHAGTRTPVREVGGLAFGPASMVDLDALHLAWHDWTLEDGPRPELLKEGVTYDVTGAEEWRSADTREEVAASERTLSLRSDGAATDAFRSGALSEERPAAEKPDRFVYDRLDVRLASLEEERLVPKGEAIRYDFRGFPFVARRLEKGSRLRLFLRCPNTISLRKNDNSGGVVSDETAKDARVAHVTVLHDAAHPSALVLLLAL